MAQPNSPSAQAFSESYYLLPIDTEKEEGNSGITQFKYIVKKGDGTSIATSVNYSVLVGSGPGNADAADFGGILPSGRIDFAAGDTQKPLLIPVSGDTLVEEAELFRVSIIYSGGVTEANGFILNDDTSQPPLDTTPPSLLSTSPADNATGVAVGADIVLTFNEKVMQGTGAVEVRTVAGNTPVASAVTFAETAVKIDPNASLAPGTEYYVRVPSGAVKDLAGNSYAGFTTTTAFNFTTASLANRPPTVTAFDKTLTAGQSVPLSDLFSARDDDPGDTITKFLVRDRTNEPGSAVLTRDGIEMQQGQLYDPAGQGIPYSELPLWRVKAGTKAGVDEIGIQVFDSNNAISTYGTVARVETKATTPTTATLSIAPLSASSADKLEGNSGGSTDFTFSVTRTGNLASASYVDWQVVAGSADKSDFSGNILPSGKLTFNANDSYPQTITVKVAADTVYENNGAPETFTVRLSNPVGATIGTSSADGRIQNDDPAPSNYLFIVNLHERGSPTGHVSGVLRGPNGNDIHLDRQSAELLGLWGLPARVRDVSLTDHRDRAIDYEVRIPLSRDEYQGMWDYAQQFVGKASTPDRYELVGRNCVDFLDDWYNHGLPDKGLRDCFTAEDLANIEAIETALVGFFWNRHQE